MIVIHEENKECTEDNYDAYDFLPSLGVVHFSRLFWDLGVGI